MTLVVLCPTPILGFTLPSGQPNAGGSVLTQVGAVNYTTYQDSAGAIALPNPIPLNSSGQVCNAAGQTQQCFLQAGVTYTFTIYDVNGNQINQASYVSSGNGIFLALIPAGSAIPTGGNGIYLPATNTIGVAVNGVLSLQVSEGSIEGYGPQEEALVDLTPDTGSFTGSITGCSASVNTSCVWARIGNLVILFLGAGSGTSNATTMTMTGLPSAIQPSRTQNIGGVNLENSGSGVLGTAQVTSSGTVTFYNGAPGTAFTSSGTKGIANGTVCYLLN